MDQNWIPVVPKERIKHISKFIPREEKYNNFINYIELTFKSFILTINGRCIESIGCSQSALAHKSYIMKISGESNIFTDFLFE